MEGGTLEPFDTILDFLSENLPSPVYHLLTTFLSYVFAAATALSTIGRSLLSSDPSTLDAQTLLPPIITLLAAYLAIMSIYRTTAWLARTIFWFMKWGSIFGIIMAGAGYFMGNAGGNAIGRNQNALPGLGEFLSKVFNDNSRSPGTRRKGASGNNIKERKPKAWDSFDRHKEWQYQEQNAIQNEDNDVQRLVDMVSSSVKHVLAGDWWSLTKSAVITDNKHPETSEQGKKGQRSKKT